MEQKAKSEKDDCRLELDRTKEKFGTLSTKLKVCWHFSSNFITRFFVLSIYVLCLRKQNFCL